MEHFSFRKRSIPVSGWFALLFLIGLLVFHGRITPAPHLEDLDSGGTLDALYALALAALVLFLAAGLGRLLLKPFKLAEWSFLERTVISVPLGLAAIGYGEFLLGLLGGLKPLHHVLYLIVIACLALPESTRFVREARVSSKTIRQSWLEFTLLQKVFAAAGVLALLFTFLQTLTPPWDYDGLMYHLQGPRLFLEAGRILPLPENWLTYYPSIWEMVYMLGMGLGSDIFARLINFIFLLLMVLSTGLFGSRFVSSRAGFISAGILVGIPILLVWGQFAYVDIAWSITQFYAVAFFLLWTKEKKINFLLLMGIFQGLALSSKYMALGSGGILTLLVLFFSVKDPRTGKVFKQKLKAPLLFVLTMLVVASPWYIKNLLWTGSPVFPFYLPQTIVDPTELSIAVDYTKSFGTGNKWYDFLLLPINLFLQFYKFGTFMGNADIPNPIFLLGFLFPFVRKKIPQSSRPVLDWMIVITALQFCTWALGMQQNRFLLPIYPQLCIISSVVILSMSSQKTKIRFNQVLSIGGVGGMIIVSCVFMFRFLFVTEPYNVFLGITTKSTMLRNVVNDYSGIEYINHRLPPDAKVFMPWDGRGYYCATGKCVADVSQAKWTMVVLEMVSPEKVNQWLISQNITHILLNLNDVYYFIYAHDPKGDHNRAYEFLLNDFGPQETEMKEISQEILLFSLDQ